MLSWIRKVFPFSFKEYVRYFEPNDRYEALSSNIEAESKEAESTSMADETQDQFQKELSAFEITALQRKLAPDNEAGYPVLDAGRGNPNWINGKVRHAFTRLMDYYRASDG